MAVGSLAVNMVKVGQWRAARLMLDLAVFKLLPALRKSTKAEARWFARQIKKNLKTGGSHSGKSIPKPQPQSLVARRLKGVTGRKPLIATGEMARAITVKNAGPLSFFIGIPRSAVSKDGHPLAHAADLSENLGAGGKSRTVTIKASRAMLTFLRIMFSGKTPKMGAGKKGGKGGKKAVRVIVVKIPSRPFMMPTFDKFYSSKDRVRRRFLTRVALNMGGFWAALAIDTNI